MLLKCLFSNQKDKVMVCIKWGKEVEGDIDRLIVVNLGLSSKIGKKEKLLSF